MKGVVLYSFLGQLGISFAQELIIDSNTIVSEGLSMTIVDTFAHLQELEVVVDSFFMFLDVVVKDTNRVIGSALVSDLAGSSAAES